MTALLLLSEACSWPRLQHKAISYIIDLSSLFRRLVSALSDMVLCDIGHGVLQHQQSELIAAEAARSNVSVMNQLSHVT